MNSEDEDVRVRVMKFNMNQTFRLWFESLRPMELKLKDPINRYVPESSEICSDHQATYVPNECYENL